MYDIREDYVHRTDIPVSDTVDSGWMEQWKAGQQNEVYQFALELANKNDVKTILDYGCGSAYKLIQNFQKYDFTGLDIKPIVTWLRTKYPNNRWVTPEELPTGNFDLVICADVIEHVPNPDELVEHVKRLAPNLIVFSTPDRDLIDAQYHKGPPENTAHHREWNYQEFETYLARSFQILDHHISNREQKTQLILCRVKK